VMQIFVINLERRPQRLAHIRAQLEARGLPFTRIDAVDGQSQKDIGYPAQHPTLTKPEFACYLSHLKAFRAFLETDAPRCLILEDDAVLAKNIAEVLDVDAFFASDNAIIRLDAPTEAEWHHPVRVARKPIAQHGRYAMFHLRSSALGSAAYVISRTVAQRILREFSEPKVQIDVLWGRKGNITQPSVQLFQITPTLSQQLQFTATPTNSGDFASDIFTSTSKEIVPESGLLNDVLQPFRNIRHNLWRILRPVYFMVVPHKLFPFDDS